MPKPPKDGINPRKSITVRLPASLVDRLREIGMTETIEQATMEWIKRIDRGQPVVEINQTMIDEAVTRIISMEWSEIISDRQWTIDLEEDGALDLVWENIRKQMDEYEDYFYNDDEYDDGEYDRLFRMYFYQAVELARTELAKRLAKIRKTLDRLYADVAMLKR
jgi:hypothetical protein